MRVWPGQPFPLGATWDGKGVNFALFSEHATKVELCLFDSPEATAEAQRIHLREQTDQVWHAYLPDVKPGQLYGYRVHGPYEPQKGHRFNPHKLVLDPFAKAIGRDLRWDDCLFGYKIGDPDADLSCDERDSAPFAPLAAVVDGAFTWGDDHPPRTSWHKTLIYELHVKGFTKRHPDVPEKLRGTYAGVASEAAIQHLLSLGVTAVELMPVHLHVDDRHLVEKGRCNYWGYNTLAFFAPALHCASRDSARVGARVQDDGACLARRRHRGHPRRGLQPYRRGQSTGADAVHARGGQRLVLLADAAGPALPHGLHRLRQHPQHAAPARPAVDHGQPALLGY